MKIKNTKTLIQRADWHARSDHIVQGTYVEGVVNGHTDFRGCAIGCLATPHTKRGMKVWFRELVKEGTSAEQYGTGEYLHAEDGWLIEEDDGAPLDRLWDEFGLAPQLMRIAECIFEDFETHEDAIDFLPAFARALPEGVDITGSMVGSWWDNNGGSSASIGWARMRATETSESMAEKLLDWLRSMKREEVAV